MWTTLDWEDGLGTRWRENITATNFLRSCIEEWSDLPAIPPFFFKGSVLGVVIFLEIRADLLTDPPSVFWKSAVGQPKKVDPGIYTH